MDKSAFYFYIFEATQSFGTKSPRPACTCLFIGIVLFGNQHGNDDDYYEYYYIFIQQNTI